jgi:hypothetical protein
VGKHHAVNLFLFAARRRIQGKSPKALVSEILRPTASSPKLRLVNQVSNSIVVTGSGSDVRLSNCERSFWHSTKRDVGDLSISDSSSELKLLEREQAK